VTLRMSNTPTRSPRDCRLLQGFDLQISRTVPTNFNTCPAPAGPTTATVTPNCHSVPRQTEHFSQLRMRSGLCIHAETNFGVRGAISPYFFLNTCSLHVDYADGGDENNFSKRSHPILNLKFSPLSKFQIVTTVCDRSHDKPSWKFLHLGN
jgi:hypothetical protein